MEQQRLFWLHIRKAAGTSTRLRLPESVYMRTDHYDQPRCFIQADPREWNDIINNYRVVLGEYTFRRAQFAKKFLYKESFDDMLSFAFSRAPLDRCLSMFYYLFFRNADIGARLLDSIRIYRAQGRIALLDARTFDIFLDVVEECLDGDKKNNINWPNLHFRTHISRMSEDIFDENGEVMLTRIYRMESLDAALAEVLNDIGAGPPGVAPEKIMNKSKQKRFTPSPEQIRRVEALYKDDFDIYERARAI